MVNQKKGAEGEGNSGQEGCKRKKLKLINGSCSFLS